MDRIKKLLGRDEEKEEEAPSAEEAAPEAEAPAEVVEETAEPESEPEPEVAAEPDEPFPVDGAATIPYHSEITDRLQYMFNDSNIAANIEGTDKFTIEFMAMGERFNFIKEALSEVKYGIGSAPDEDVFIRISNDAVAELLSAPNFEEFRQIYMKYYRNPDAGKFVKIELRKDLVWMNRQGYARVPLLKLLVGQVR
ncbi:MAG: hypothetical protein ACW975_04145 [Candidatus Thorarchaeota archaeon]|jgi:hypothetical protein